MKRLTFKNEYGYGSIENVHRIIERLGQLEDIEEQIGIPLELLLKALTSEEVWMKSNVKYADYNKPTLFYSTGVEMCDGVLCIFNDFGEGKELTSFGKEWGLEEGDFEHGQVM